MIRYVTVRRPADVSDAFQHHHDGRDHVERGLLGEGHQEDDAVRPVDAGLRRLQSDTREAAHERRS